VKVDFHGDTRSLQQFSKRSRNVVREKIWICSGKMVKTRQHAEGLLYGEVQGSFDDFGSEERSVEVIFASFVTRKSGNFFGKPFEVFRSTRNSYNRSTRTPLNFLE
jgi:hypothetical protein